MLRLESATGWWLTTHPDHARLAAAFAEHWGNSLFARPEPRHQVLHAIAAHDDGWARRDAAPQITRQGRPSAFSSDLVGKYSAFEEIDLSAYLKVREDAVRLVAASDPYAARLISMHTYNLLSERADRSTIVPEQLPLLDAFLAEQRLLQEQLYAIIQNDDDLKADERCWDWIDAHFHLLQACDNLSLLSCVDYAGPANLLHPLRLHGSGTSRVEVQPLGDRTFRLTPYPLETSPLTVEFPARHVDGKTFASAEELQQKYAAAETSSLSVRLTE